MHSARFAALLFSLTSFASLAAPFTNVTAVTAGGEYQSAHSCALKSGAVWCWGFNADGELGDGSTDTSRPGPGIVPGLATGVVAVATTYRHACALTSGGGVKCWGNNGLGQLGDGTTTNRSTPVDVAGHTSGVVAISVGYTQSCALSAAGAVSCWGGNSIAGSNSNGGLTSGISAIGSGFDFNCALTSAGGVKCWGSNNSGQLGNGTTANGNATAQDVSGLASGATAISVGSNHACALNSTGGVKCWGNNGTYSGILGNGNTSAVYYNVPVDVTGLSSGVTAISAGGSHTCALMTSGAVRCWGINSYGQVGTLTSTLQPTPVDVAGLPSDIATVSAGRSHTCATTMSGSAWCWGSNFSGELGRGTYYYMGHVNPQGLAPALVGSFSTQAITFAPLANRLLTESPIQLTATASSGLPVAYVSLFDATSPLSSCSVSGTTLTFQGTGLCSLLATQVGDGDYFAAPNVTRAFVIADAAALATPHLANISTRALVNPGHGNAIAGFAIRGPQRKTVVVRGIGPSLASAGLGGLLSDPTLELYRGATRIGESDDWQGWNGQEHAAILQSLGLAPTDPRESALVVGLDPGLYTVVMGGKGETGIGSVEVFEVDRPESPLVNIATRAYVGTGNDVMIAGFIIQGTGPQTVVVTAAGPSLAGYVANALGNPVLSVIRQSDGVTIGHNDNWQTQANPADVAAIQASGVVPAHVLESAVILTLPPGAYTAIVQGIGGTGTALVGAYVVP